ncbi:hypothetical protein NLI96_g12058 [Meripilus lineatus]|uniref:Uncharacterized protein n=1 Tax=Meripilus lineatus TaxID=2056292 RepID=A0AAD5UQQ4_9APHY|nr:hypothetical protein NLI96_g12058 [Physisporinus lineatus]
MGERHLTFLENLMLNHCVGSGAVWSEGPCILGVVPPAHWRSGEILDRGRNLCGQQGIRRLFFFVFFIGSRSADLSATGLLSIVRPDHHLARKNFAPPLLTEYTYPFHQKCPPNSRQSSPLLVKSTHSSPLRTYGIRQDQEKGHHICTSPSSQVPLLIVYTVRPPAANTQSPPKKTRGSKTAATIPEEPDQMDVIGEPSDQGPHTPSEWAMTDQSDSDSVALKVPTDETGTADAAKQTALNEIPVAAMLTDITDAGVANQVVTNGVAVAGVPVIQAIPPIAVANPGAHVAPLQNANQVAPNNIQPLPVGMANPAAAPVQGLQDRVTAESHPHLAPILERVNTGLVSKRNIGLAQDLHWYQYNPIMLVSARETKSHFWFYGQFVEYDHFERGGWRIKLQFLLSRDATRGNPPCLFLKYRDWGKDTPPPFFDCVEDSKKARKPADFCSLNKGDLVLVEGSIRRFQPSGEPKRPVAEWPIWRLAFDITVVNLIKRGEGELAGADDDEDEY